MKREALEHTKLKRLRRRLNLPKWQAVGLLETLWHLTAKQTPRGDIGKLSDEDIAIGIDYSGDEILMVDALVASGWVDRHPEHRLLIHDWHEHCDDGVHMKLARGRIFFATGHTPKTSRLPKNERSQADNFFDSVRTVRQSAQHGVHTKAENVVTASADLDPAPPLPSPPPPPPPLPHVTDKANGNGRRRHENGNGLTLTLRELRTHFADTTQGFAERLRTKARRAAKEGGSDPDLVTDQLLAQTVKSCTKRNQESAGLYLDTVPAVIGTLAETEEK